MLDDGVAADAVGAGYKGDFGGLEGHSGLVLVWGRGFVEMGAEIWLLCVEVDLKLPGSFSGALLSIPIYPDCCSLFCEKKVDPCHVLLRLVGLSCRVPEFTEFTEMLGCEIVMRISGR